jgi:2-keto-3-deoxy-L-rhamnonate aldolase RhmA
MVNSRVLEKLRAGEFVRTIGVSRVRDPWIAEVIGKLGFDVIWLDMEHRSFGQEIVDAMSLACRATGIDLMVRILKDGYMAPMRALEGGANGIMVPHCRSVAEARQWVEWARFPPLGRRGFDGAGADADYFLTPPLEHLRHANEQTFLTLQIEDVEAVECVEEIAAIEGVDLLFIGPADISISYGVPMQIDHPKVQGAIDRVAAACEKHGKWWGMPTGTPEAAQKLIDRGARMITCTGDHGLLVNGLVDARKRFADLRVGRVAGA